MINVIIAIGAMCTQSSQVTEYSVSAQARCKAYYAECIGPLYGTGQRAHDEVLFAEKFRQCILKRELPLIGKH